LDRLLLVRAKRKAAAVANRGWAQSRCLRLRTSVPSLRQAGREIDHGFQAPYDERQRVIERLHPPRLPPGLTGVGIRSRLRLQTEGGRASETCTDKTYSNLPSFTLIDHPDKGSRRNCCAIVFLKSWMSCRRWDQKNSEHVYAWHRGPNLLIGAAGTGYAALDGGETR